MLKENEPTEVMRIVHILERGGAGAAALHHLVQETEVCHHVVGIPDPHHGYLKIAFTTGVGITGGISGHVLPVATEADIHLHRTPGADIQHLQHPIPGTAVQDHVLDILAANVMIGIEDQFHPAEAVTPHHIMVIAGISPDLLEDTAGVIHIPPALEQVIGPKEITTQSQGMTNFGH